MESGESRSSSSERHIAYKDSSWFSQFRNGSNPWMARYVYALIFLVATLLAWAARDYGRSALTEMERLKGCEGEKDCLGAEGVLRTFFITMFLSTTGSSKLGEPRDSWHSGWWSVKIPVWIFLTIIPFLLPSAIIQLYGGFAHFGAGGNNFDVHLVRTRAILPPQHLLRYLDLGTPPIHDQRLSSPKSKCWHLDTRAHGALCSIHLEPAGGSCIRKTEATDKTDWLTIISFVVAVLAMVIATFSTGIDSKCFQLQFRTDDVQAEDDDVPYGYGFFHFVFATGAMYFAMLLIGWNTHHAMRKWTIDVGWTSTWVRIVNEWLAVCVYLWMLVSPIIWKNRHAAEST
ncbi:serine incorporator 1 [Quercus suber]|uniref:Serine incorporator 1 n=1 Tax=Quercus suber TaxID=58331 RepID=A0AAW0KTF4_QUESU